VSLAENAAAGIVAGADADVTDADGDIVTFSLVGAPVDGSNNPLFTIDSDTGQIALTVAGAAFIDYETTPTYVLTVKASDGEVSHEQSATVTVNLTNVNDTLPVLTVDNAMVSLAENAAAGDVAGADADATDADGDIVTFSLVGAPVDGSNNPLFAIDSDTGQISLTAAGAAFIDYETTPSYLLTVKASDGNVSHDQTSVITVNLSNVNEAPTITTTALNVEENIAVAGSIAVIDPDAGDQRHYQLVGGDDVGLFAISAGGVLSFNHAPDYETPIDVGGDNTYQVSVRVEDDHGLFATQSIIVTVLNDTTEAPITETNTGLSVAENSTNTVISNAVLNTTDQDTGTTAIVYTLVDISSHGVLTKSGVTMSTGSTFTQANINNGLIKYSNNGDESATDGFTFTISDGTNSLTTQEFAITVSNVNDPGSVSISGAATENVTLTANVSDPEGTGIISYQWKANGSNIGGATGHTLLLTDSQVGKVISVVASYTDGKGTAELLTSAATAAVANVNDSPTGSVSISGRKVEGGTLTASNTLADADGLGTIGYQWKANGNNIVGATGSTLLLSGAEAGKTITVTASYTDGWGTPEQVTSAPTPVINAHVSGTSAPDTLNGSTSDDWISGLASGDVINGLAGDDRLEGDDGNDSINGGTGADAMLGGLGDDTYTVDDGGDSVVELPGQGSKDLVNSSVSYTLGANVERLNLTGSGTIKGTGNELANILFGDSNPSANTLAGGLGDDEYYVGTGDVVEEAAGAGTGNDLVNSKLDWILGANIEKLWLYGSAAVNGTGNELSNTLYGQANTAANVLTGGLGNDTYHVGSNDGIVEVAGQGTDDAICYGDYVLAAGVSVETLSVSGTTGRTLTGNELANTLLGNTGNDTLNGGGGNDTLNGGTGADSMVGGLGDDTYTVDDGGDSVVELPGQGSKDLVNSSVSFTLGANVERLNLTGSGTIKGTGNELANVLFGDTNLSANTLAGGLGDDEYYVGTGDVVEEAAGAGTGNDLVNSKLDWILGANIEKLWLYGSAAVNGTGNELSNTLYGQANTAANVLTGGLGNDTYHVGSNDGIVEVAGQGTDDAICYGDYVLAAGVSVETLSVSGTTGRTLTGNELANTLLGNTGNDTLNGGGGNDTLNGGTGADSMVGGLGDDTYTVDNVGDSVVELPGQGSKDLVNSSVSFTLGANVERLNLTGSGTIKGTGNELANVLFGDTNLSANTLAGGLGDDEYYVGTGDVVEEAAGAGTGNDLVNSKLDWILGANIEKLWLYGSAAVNGTGNELSNTLYGQANTAANVLTGGLGNDTYHVGSNDGIVEVDGQGTDTAYCYGDYILTAGVSVETMSVSGTTGRTLTGNELANTLLGNTGNDTLNGGLGNDTLAGGNGADVFRFDTLPSTSTNRDTISDYSVVNDTIQLENAIFTSLAATGTLAAGSFVVGTAALDGNDFVIYNSGTGALLYDADGNGATNAAVEIATIGIGLALTNLDFMVT
jgi:Ca2+-binding RTX toxin-like protein